MNSQQELLDAINAITENKEKSFDTPATVLRVDNDTVWVHIDGGADETPVSKTINCEQGETVQVRIANGSAFLVGNASAPPTDDKTANVAHFVAEQADEKATQAIETANAIVQTVSEKVSSGSSNVSVLSSTMYQDAYGVNIFNDTLAVGDSYAHIDGDSFDIKQATTAGTIDNVNDTLVASFGREVTIGSRWGLHTVGNYSKVMGEECDASGSYSYAEGWQTSAEANYSHAEGMMSTITSSGIGSHIEGGECSASGKFCHVEGLESIGGGMASHAQNWKTIADSFAQTVIGKANISDANDTYALIIGNGYHDDEEGIDIRSDALRVKWDGSVIDGNGNKISPTILESTTISASTTSYTFSDASITDDSVIDIYDTIFGFAPTAMTVSAGTCTVTFPAQSSTHKIKLFVY